VTRGVMVIDVGLWGYDGLCKLHQWNSSPHHASDSWVLHNFALQHSVTKIKLVVYVLVVV